MTLMKLRLNLSNLDSIWCQWFHNKQDLHEVDFRHEKTTEILDLATIIQWPDREALQRTMSFCVRGLKVVAIIDCFEIFVENHPSCWQNYAHGLSTNTTTLPSTGITPQGGLHIQRLGRPCLGQSQKTVPSSRWCSTCRSRVYCRCKFRDPCFCQRSKTAICHWSREG